MIDDARLRAAHAMHAAGQVGEAATAYESMLLAAPDDPQLLTLLGTARLQLGAADEAQRLLERSLQRRPTQPIAWLNRGVALTRIGRLDLAERCFSTALAQHPRLSDAWSNRAVARHRAGRTADALADCERALAIDPDSADALQTLGLLYEAQGRMDEALNACDRALARAADHAAARLTKALLCLRQGDYACGWRLYEARWDQPEAARDAGGIRGGLACPRWTGSEPIAGLTLFIYAEQGLGDLIQFCRYAAELVARGARVLLEAPATLAPLLRSLPQGVELVEPGCVPRHFDLHCALMSLPLACGTTVATIPAHVPYLHASPAAGLAWRERLGPRRAPRVGLAWSGASIHRNDHNRSLPLSRLASLWNLPLEFHCLQTDVRPQDVAALGASPVVRHDTELGDFGQTAALVDCMDLVISVDTSVAHLAGALGRPVWILLPFVADWRWLRGRDDSPWYPTARLFRQPDAGRWDDVIESLAQALATLLA